MGTYIVIADCKTCRHRSQVDLQNLAVRFGKAGPTKNLQRRLRCSKCGARRPIIATLTADSTSAGDYLRGLESGGFGGVLHQLLHQVLHRWTLCRDVA